MDKFVAESANLSGDTELTISLLWQAIYKKDGFVNGFLIRGLGTKIVTNGLQGILFSVLWRLGMDWYNKNEKEKIK